MEDIQNPTQDQNQTNASPTVSTGPKEAPRTVSEFIKPSEQREIDQELAEFVKPTPEEPTLSPEAQKAGVNYAPSATPAQTEPTGKVEIMSDEEAQRIIKETHNFNTDVGEYDDHRGYTAPSRDFFAALVHKVHKHVIKVVGMFKPKQTQTV